MTATIDVSCPNGCFELEVRGHHAGRDDREYVQDVALRDEPGPCPNCGAAVDRETIQEPKQ